MADQALKSWMHTLISYVRSGQPDLTNRQMALMLLVYLTPGPHTVRGLAHLLGVSKPVITRALNTLGSLGYLRRVRDESDRRNVFVARTSTGQEFLEGFERNLEQQAAPSAAKPASERTGTHPPARMSGFALTGPSLTARRANPRLSQRSSPTSRLAGQVLRAPLCAAADARLRRAAGLRPRRARRRTATPSPNCSPARNSRCSNMPAAGPGAIAAPTMSPAMSRRSRSPIRSSRPTSSARNARR